MSYYKDIKLEVGDKIKYIGDGEGTWSTPNNIFKHGDVLTVLRDPISKYPMFSNGKIEGSFNIEDRKWVKVSSDESVPPVPSGRIERDKEYSLVVTGEQMAFIWMLTGWTNGGWDSKSALYNELETMFIGQSGMIEYPNLNNLCSSEVLINSWLDKLFTAPKTKGQLRKEQEEAELREAIKATEETLEGLKAKLERY